MIAFVTLLLGLVTGNQAVELAAGEDVALVELRLDGRFAGAASGPPWIVNCDFGAELSPHELAAVAYDDQRRELQTVRQWVNLPRERVEARLTLERTEGERGRTTATARLIWSALDHQEAPAVKLTFDGQPLPAADFDAIALPAHDPRGLHFLRAELEFAPVAEGGAPDYTHAELVFGGTFGDQVATELTALAFTAGKRPPKPERMAGWLRKGDETLEVAAVDRGPLNLLIVRERSVTTFDGLQQVFLDYRGQDLQARTEVMGFGGRQRRPGMPGRPPAPAPAVLAKGDRVRFVFPTTGREQVRVGLGAAPLATEQVPVSADVIDYGPLFDQLTTAFWEKEEAPAERQQLADAVAVAGVVAAAGDRRRAVLLVTSGAARDESRFSPATVREYLRRLGVPLVIWSVAAEEGAPSPWGETVDVSTYARMKQALKDLRKMLAPQVVVWVEGAHLGHEIELTEKAEGLRPIS